MPDGTPILACDDGTVVYSDNTPDSNGMGVNILHNWGISQYWHLSKLTAKMGDNIKKGEVLGLSGHSGWATGPHLHFGVKVKEIVNTIMHGWSDPALYFEDAPINPEPIYPINKTYMILPGDTLWGIAVKFYENGTLWEKIYKANMDRILDPRRIFPFSFINIP
jgi:murein DD-endopeptidase MepM/ murein hydrolase activator NlpD